MRIVSQNGMIDAPYEMTTIRATGTFIRMNMVGDTGRGTVIAEYGTPSKAERAIGMLREVYVAHENYKKMSAELQLEMAKTVGLEKAFMYGGVFRFPWEDEIE